MGSSVTGAAGVKVKLAGATGGGLQSRNLGQWSVGSTCGLYMSSFSRVKGSSRSFPCQFEAPRPTWRSKEFWTSKVSPSFRPGGTL